MILMRCAWHRKYRGYPWVYDLDLRRGQGLLVSDGMCRSCARRWRAECLAGRAVLEEPASSPIIPAWMPRVGLGLALATAVILSARPLDTTVRRPLPDMRRAAIASALPAAVATARFEPAAAQPAVPRCPAPATARSRKPQPIRAAAVRRPVPVRTTTGEGPLCRPLQALRTVFSGIGDCRGIFSRGGGSVSDTFLAQAP